MQTVCGSLPRTLDYSAAGAAFFAGARFAAVFRAGFAAALAAAAFCARYAAHRLRVASAIRLIPAALILLFFAGCPLPNPAHRFRCASEIRWRPAALISCPFGSTADP